MFLLLWCVSDMRGRWGPAARESIRTHVRNHKTEHLKTSTFTLFMTLAKCKPVMAIFADHLLVPSRTLWVTAFMWPEWLFSSQQKMALNLIKDGIVMKPRVRSLTGQHLKCNRHSIHYFDNTREPPSDSLNLPKQFKYFRFVTDTLFHALLHRRHHRLRLVFGAVLWTLLGRPCKTHYNLKR